MSTLFSQLFRVRVVLSRWTFHKKCFFCWGTKKCYIFKIGEQSLYALLAIEAVLYRSLKISGNWYNQYFLVYLEFLFLIALVVYTWECLSLIIFGVEIYLNLLISRARMLVTSYTNTSVEITRPNGRNRNGRTSGSIVRGFSSSFGLGMTRSGTLFILIFFKMPKEPMYDSFSSHMSINQFFLLK